MSKVDDSIAFHLDRIRKEIDYYGAKKYPHIFYPFHAIYKAGEVEKEDIEVMEEIRETLLKEGHLASNWEPFSHNDLHERLVQFKDFMIYIVLMPQFKSKYEEAGITF